MRGNALFSREFKINNLDKLIALKSQFKPIANLQAQVIFWRRGLKFLQIKEHSISKKRDNDLDFFFLNQCDGIVLFLCKLAYIHWNCFLDEQCGPWASCLIFLCLFGQTFKTNRCNFL